MTPAALTLSPDASGGVPWLTLLWLLPLLTSLWMRRAAARDRARHVAVAVASAPPSARSARPRAADLQASLPNVSPVPTPRHAAAHATSAMSAGQRGQ